MIFIDTGALDDLNEQSLLVERACRQGCGTEISVRAPATEVGATSSCAPNRERHRLLRPREESREAHDNLLGNTWRHSALAFSQNGGGYGDHLAELSVERAQQCSGHNGAQ